MGMAALLLIPASGHACSVCGGAAMGTDPGTGFNTSLFFLIAMPYLVVGAIAGWLLYRYRRASGRRKMAPSQQLTSLQHVE
jgi:LPXTG-motif cell wall-anchored protein